MKLAPGKDFWETNTPTLLAAARATPRHVRAVWRAVLPRLLAVLRLLGRPSVLGAAYLFWATARTAQGPLIDASERAFGADASRIDALVRSRFMSTIIELRGRARDHRDRARRGARRGRRRGRPPALPGGGEAAPEPARPRGGVAGADGR